MWVWRAYRVVIGGLLHAGGTRGGPGLGAALYHIHLQTQRQGARVVKPEEPDARVSITMYLYLYLYLYLYNIHAHTQSTQSIYSHEAHTQHTHNAHVHTLHTPHTETEMCVLLTAPALV
jgi:hypothetical protein